MSVRLLSSLAVVLYACSSAPPPVAVPAHLEPAALGGVADPDEAKQVLRLRVYAGAAYRARVVGWEEELSKVLTASSAILHEACGTRIELVESLDWKLSGGNLPKALQSLIAFDPAVDVDFTIGLIDAAATAEDDYAKLLAAELLGKHAVVRSYNRLAESERLASATGDLDEAGKEALLDRRRRHKQTLIVVRAIAQAFGASAEGSYRITDTTLDTRASAIACVTMEATAAAEASKADRSKIWADAIGKLEALKVDPGLIQRAKTLGLGSKPDVLSDADVLAALRSVDRETVALVKDLLREGKAASAWESLEPLTELYPRNREIVALACEVAFARKASDALERCRHATHENPESGESWLRVGRLLVEAEPAAALQSLRKAESLLGEESADWGLLARAYRKLSLPTMALAAATKTKRQSAVATTIVWAQESRIRYGSNIGVEPESEARYLVALKDGLKLVYKNDYKAATVAAADLRSSFPKSIAGDLVLCEIGVRRRKYDAAKRACQAVLAIQPENVWSRYLLGIVGLREGKDSKAMEHLAAVLAKDPGLKAAYQALAKLYRKRSDPRLSGLKSQYKERFGSELK